MIKFRLQRCGRTHDAKYHLVVADARSPRDGKFIKLIGYYYPKKNEYQFDEIEYKKYRASGAQNTDGFERILKKLNININ